MQKIREWMEQNPDGAKELRRQNRSYVFFREVQLSDKDEAVGAQGVPLTPGRSIAVDKSLHVYGTPFFIEGELPIESEQSKTPFHRLMIAQDTGSAITGPARADLYFGAGADAGRVSGRLRHNMRFVMLVPKSLDPVGAGRKMPVPDARPSEKIAKLFPQTDPLKDQPKDQKTGSNAGSRTRRRHAPSPQRRSRKRPHAAKTGAAAGGAAGHQAGRARRPRHIVAIAAAADEAPAVRSIPDLSPPPRRKRGLSEEERALWESVAKQSSRCGKSTARQSRRLRAPETEAPAAAKPALRTKAAMPVQRGQARHQSRRRRRWRRSDAASARSFRAAARKSTPGSICTA